MNERADEKKQNFEDRRKGLLERINKRNAYAKCFNTEAGRYVLLDLIIHFGFLNSSFANSNLTTFSLGEKNSISYMASHVPDIFYHVLWEHGQREVEKLERDLAAQRKELELDTKQE